MRLGFERIPVPIKLRIPSVFVAGVSLRVIISVVKRETTQTTG